MDSVRTLADIDRLVDSFFGDQGLDRRMGVAAHLPAVDIREKDDSYVLEAELPGFGENDVEVNLNGTTITIESKKEDSTEKNDEAGNYLIRERSVRHFIRSWTLPDNADPGSVDAGFKDGLLTLSIKKRTEAQKRVIEIKKKSA
jgi:HSP20 family protein